ncbi:MAG: hypothetical protein RBT38_02070 [Bacteroidales bacterium]|nr:hypothetical protein [Bacteroidales bacterium]
MLISLLFSILFAVHPVHVSLLSLDYSKENDIFRMFVRIYFDDFLLDAGISEQKGLTLNFAGANNYTSEVVEKYVNEKIRIFVNSKLVQSKIENMDLSDNELRLNLTAKAGGGIRSITVRNLIMTALYTDQANMIIVKVDDFEEGARLTPYETEKTFEIKH